MRSSAKYAILAVPFVLLFAVLGACGGGGDDGTPNTDTTATATALIGNITLNPTALGGIDTTPGAPSNPNGDGQGGNADGTSPTASSGQPGTTGTAPPDATISPDVFGRATHEAQRTAEEVAQKTSDARERENDDD